MVSNRFALNVGFRALLLAVLVVVCLELLLRTHLYATVVILIGMAFVTLIDLKHYAARADRMLGRFVDDLIAGETFRRSLDEQSGHDFGALALSLQRAMNVINASQTARQREIEYLRTLAENVSAALLVFDANRKLTYTNRAAKKLLRESARATACTAPGDPLLGGLATFPPGHRTIIRPTDGQRMLASVAEFTSGAQPYRLIALQNIESELDAVEIKAWRDLARVLAHEIMNSLTPIASLAQSLKPLMKDQAEDVALALDTISRRSNSLMHFVERYRQVVALPKPVIRPVRVADILGRIEQLMAPTLAADRIEWHSRIEPEELAMGVDPELIEQALINLIHNAIEATITLPAPRIEVHCRAQEARICLSVIDNGSGFDPALRDQLFMPFFTTRPGGSGIGLSLVRQIALAHEGQVEATRSQAGRTVFTLSIPA